MDSSAPSPPDPPAATDGARAEGDYSELFSRYARRVKGYLERKGLSPAAAEALTQVAMLTAWQRFHRKDRAPVLFDTWIFCVARDQRAGLLRRRLRPEPDPDDACWVADEAEPLPVAPPGQTTHMRLRKALDDLSDEQRDALKHLYFQGQSTTALARALSTGEDLVRERIRSALHTLRSPSAEGSGDGVNGDHHPTQDELLSYVVGNCDTWLATLLACHLTLCPPCRREVQLLEDLGGALFDLWADELGATVAAPDHRPPPPSDPPSHPTLPSQPPPHAIQYAVPRPLHGFMSDARTRYRFLLPGLDHIPLTLTAGGRLVRLLRFEPGFAIEEHGHAGLEWSIVLSGSVRETATGETFGRGHICRRRPSDVHSLVVGEEQPCIAAIATLGALRPRTFRGKMAVMVVGR